MSREYSPRWRPGSEMDPLTSRPHQNRPHIQGESRGPKIRLTIWIFELQRHESTSGSIGRGTATGKKKGGGGETQLQVSPDGAPELEEALGVCERGLALARDLPLGVRAPLLTVWVRCRQLLHQPIPSNTLGVEEKVLHFTLSCPSVAKFALASSPIPS